MPPMLLKWLQENVTRLRQTSPLFFKWWNIVANVLLLSTGLPYLIAQFETIFNFTTPEPFSTLSNKFLSGLAVGFKFMSMLTVNTSTVGQTEEGKPIQVPNETKLPFTTEAEKAKVEETVPQPPVIEEVPENAKEAPKS